MSDTWQSLIGDTCHSQIGPFVLSLTRTGLLMLSLTHVGLLVSLLTRAEV